MLPIIRIDGTKKHDMGRGFIANVHIPAGTRIAVEQPIFRVRTTFLTEPHTEQREAAVRRELTESLTPYTVQQFLKLHTGKLWTSDFKDTPFSGTILGAAIPLSLRDGYNGSDEVGVFLLLSRMNHSCRPNCQQTFNAIIGAEQLYTLRDIAVNEEITVSYVPDAAINPQYLRNIFDFDCTCDWCLQAEEVQIESQYRLSTIDSLDDRLIAAADIEDMVSALQIGVQILNLMYHENIRDYRLGVTYQTLFNIVVKAGDKRKAKYFAVLAYMAFELCEGPDSPAILQMQKRFCKILGFENGNRALGRLAQQVRDDGGYYLGFSHDSGENIFAEDVLDEMFVRREWKVGGMEEEQKCLREILSASEILNRMRGKESRQIEPPNLGNGLEREMKDGK